MLSCCFYICSYGISGINILFKLKDAWEKQFTLLVFVKLLHNLFKLEINTYLFIFVNSNILFINESDDALTGERRLIQYVYILCLFILSLKDLNQNILLIQNIAKRVNYSS